MTNFGKKYSSLITNRKTYRIGLLQAKAYRILNKRIDSLLSHTAITSCQWAILGLAYDNNKQGVGHKEMARLMGITAPSLTEMLVSLEKQNYVEYSKDIRDARAKLVHITKKGEGYVEKMEKVLRRGMKPLLKDSSLPDLAGYISVLESIIENTGSEET